MLCSSQDNDQKLFSVPVPYNICLRKLLGKNTWFISFDWRVKSYSVNEAAGTGLVITSTPLSVSYSRFLYSLSRHLCRGKASDGRSWKGRAARELDLSGCGGSGPGNSSHFCCWLDVWPWANHISSVGFAPPCLSLCVIQNSVKCCCADLRPFSILSLCISEQSEPICFFHLYLV